MDLNSIIPNDDRWSYNNGIIYFKKLQKIPILVLIEDIPHILLENKIPKQVIQLTSILMNSGLEFYFTTPLASNPSGVLDYKREVITSYFNSYSNFKFLRGFNKIEFDLIKNLIEWVDKNDANELLKPVYEKINKSIQMGYYDYYQKKDIYGYGYDIREEFRTLWRDIQISKIISGKTV